MHTDPGPTADPVPREVRTGSRDGTPTKITIARRVYPTDRADLWDALTDPDRIPRWFLPISGELRAGGRYQLEGQAGGEVESCEEPEFFAITWEFGGQMSWVRVRLTEAGDGTVLELAHEAFVDPEFWGQFGPGAAGVGWDLALAQGLARHLESGAAVDPAAAEAWTLSPEGVQFVRQSAEGWAAAAVADGDEPGPAHEAAERTIAFYTTAPETTPSEDAPDS